MIIPFAVLPICVMIASEESIDVHIDKPHRNCGSLISASDVSFRDLVSQSQVPDKEFVKLKRAISNSSLCLINRVRVVI